MATFTFAGPDFATVVAAAAKHNRKFFMAKDDGIYIGADTTKGQKPVVCYAKGYDPRSGDIWDKAQAAAGGDDFGEHFDIDAKSMALAQQPGSSMKIKLTATRLDITIHGPEPEHDSAAFRTRLAAQWATKGISDIVWHSDRHVTMTAPSSRGGFIRADYKRATLRSKDWKPQPGTVKKVEPATA